MSKKARFVDVNINHFLRFLICGIHMLLTLADEEEEEEEEKEETLGLDVLVGRAW